jgi:hypothetical protein
MMNAAPKARPKLRVGDTVFETLDGGLVRGRVTRLRKAGCRPVRVRLAIPAWSGGPRRYARVWFMPSSLTVVRKAPR